MSSLPLADQLSFLESELEALKAKQNSQTVEVPAHSRKKFGRKALPEELPRFEILHDLSEAEKTCACGTEISRIGEDCSEQLEYIPAKLHVLKHIRPKYACRACQRIDDEGPTVQIAPAPKHTLPKSIASAGLFSSDHHRQVGGISEGKFTFLQVNQMNEISQKNFTLP